MDVERNLRSPLAGMANMARRMGVEFREPTISVRTGDTPQRERARFTRHPADILITTPEFHSHPWPAAWRGARAGRLSLPGRMPPGGGSAAARRRGREEAGVFRPL